MKTKSILAACLLFTGIATSVAQSYPKQETVPSVVQIVALDECDPTTFNLALGPDFCHNVTLGAFTTLSDLFSKAASGKPDPGWDFEPDGVHLNQATVLSVANQGGELHTFTEVRRFGGGFIEQLNPPGETVVPECENGFSNLAVARTRILQGSELKMAGLSKGKHRFQCCIHPWMRVEVDVK